MSPPAIRPISADKYPGALLLRLNTASEETGICTASLRRIVEVIRIGRSNYVRVAEVNTHIRGLLAQSSKFPPDESQRPADVAPPANAA